MRIVGGKLKGRALVSPTTNDVRPTTDRNRESLFNILTHKPNIALEGARVLDLFAGTGALGIEALSRGASFALFVEMGAEQRGTIRENIHNLGLQGASKIFRRDATKLGHIGSILPFDLVFADPPYNKSLAESALNALLDGQWLKSDAHIVVEESATADFKMPLGYEMIEMRKMGNSRLHIISRS